MKFYHQGDKSKAICGSCGRLASTTFTYRDVPFDDGSGLVKDILAGVCDTCGEVVSIPPQSTPAIRRAHPVADVSLEVQLPASALEILDLAAYRVQPDITSRFRKALLSFYIRRLAGQKIRQEAVETPARKSNQRPNPAIPRKRLSCKLTPQTSAALDLIMRDTGLSKTKAILAIIHQIEIDLIVPDNPPCLETLREIAAS